MTAALREIISTQDFDGRQYLRIVQHIHTLLLLHEIIFNAEQIGHIYALFVNTVNLICDDLNILNEIYNVKI